MPSTISRLGVTLKPGHYPRKGTPYPRERPREGTTTPHPRSTPLKHPKGDPEPPVLSRATTVADRATAPPFAGGGWQINRDALHLAGGEKEERVGGREGKDPARARDREQGISLLQYTVSLRADPLHSQ
jgi:hypothetical protein